MSAKSLEEFIYPTQSQLFSMLARIYRQSAIISKGNYILVPGEAPVMLLAHMDTVHKEQVCDLCKSKGGNILMSPQGVGGDDRCGIYALHTVYERATVKPWLLFTCNEEIGGLGAYEFADDFTNGKLPDGLYDLKILVEIDRKGANDAVYYDCDNPELETYITGKGFKTSWGSFSDISVVAPELGVAAVNLSSGYYNAHTLYEYINRSELHHTIDRVLSIVDDASDPEFPFFQYIEKKYSGSWKGFKYYDCDDLYSIPTIGSGKKQDADDDEEEDEQDKYAEPDPDFAYQREYDALLDLYSAKYLDKVRTEMGDGWIEYLFESEFGGTYEEVFPELADDEEREEM